MSIKSLISSLKLRMESQASLSTWKKRILSGWLNKPRICSWKKIWCSTSKRPSKYSEMYMDSTMICSDCSSMEAFLQNTLTFFSGTTSIGEGKASKPSASSSPTKSNILKKSTFSEVTISQPLSLASMASTKNVTNLLLRQDKIQHQSLEGHYRRLQLHAHRSSNWRENTVHAWRTLPRVSWSQTNQLNRKAHWNTG